MRRKYRKTARLTPVRYPRVQPPDQGDNSGGITIWTNKPLDLPVCDLRLPPRKSEIQERRAFALQPIEHVGKRLERIGTAGNVHTPGAERLSR